MNDLKPAASLATRREIMQRVGAAALICGTSPLLAAGHSRKTGEQPLREVKMIENIWIPMSDGTRIAARVWMPVDAEQHKVPVIMEYIPYRKRDGTRLFDEPRHAYWAAHGYACIRPDIRGSGDSEGIQGDEYVEQEQDDGVEIIQWLVRQPWCNGSVGLVGYSWGGISALQIAARQPPALKAILTHCFTDDRYADDCHYIGGCLAQDMFLWGSMFFTTQAAPPDPAIVGADRWRAMWKERLEKLHCHMADWMQHQERDAYWKHGSVSENYADIRCPVYAISGWVDPYSTAVPRLLTGLKVPRKALLGPWGHNYPYNGVPGPAIEYLDEALRWWDHWLKGLNTGVMKEPVLRAWMQNDASCCGMTETRGRWVAEHEWPSRRIRDRSYYLVGTSLMERPGPETVRTLAPAQTVGITAGHWVAVNLDTELPKTQQMDDGRSLCFDSEPLSEPLEMLGAPRVGVEVSVDRPVALLAVRLNEVYPDGSSRRITYGVLNLTHRESHENPELLEPGRRYRLDVRLKDVAHSFAVGNRLRVAISTSYWPMVMPAPQPVHLTLFTGRSELRLPVRPPAQTDAGLAPFRPPPPAGADQGVEVLEPPADGYMTFETDMATGLVTMRSGSSNGRTRLTAIGTILGGGSEEIMTINDSDPEGATARYRRWASWERGEWNVRVETVVHVTLTRTEYVLKAEIAAQERGATVFTNAWTHRIARRFV